MQKELSGVKRKANVIRPTPNTKDGKKVPAKKSKRNGKAPAVKGAREPRGRRSRKQQQSNSDEDSDSESWPCLVCGETFSRSRETWVQCQECKKWAHEDCTDGTAYFLCPNCDSDDDM